MVDAATTHATSSCKNKVLALFNACVKILCKLLNPYYLVEQHEVVSVSNEHSETEPRAAVPNGGRKVFTVTPEGLLNSPFHLQYSLSSTRLNQGGGGFFWLGKLLQFFAKRSWTGYVEQQFC